MAVNVSYPGVYIQEVPSGSRAIAGVPTSIAAFVGYTARGPVDEAVQIFSYADFERRFGGLHRDSDLSYAVSHFFLNGGGTCWIVRIAENAAAASVDLQTSAGATTLTATASSEGAWGNALRITVDYGTSDPLNTFNLTVAEVADQNGRLVTLRSETHRNLSMNDQSATYAVTAVNAASDLIELADANLAGAVAGTSESGEILPATIAGLTDDNRQLAVSVDGSVFHQITLFDPGDNTMATLQNLADRIETQINQLDGISGVDVSPGGPGIVATSGTTGRNSSIIFRNSAIQNAAQVLNLGIANGGREVAGASFTRPAKQGITGGRVADFSAINAGDTVEIDLVNLTDLSTAITSVSIAFAATPTTLEEAATVIAAALAAETNPAFRDATVFAADGAIHILSGSSDPLLGLSLPNGGAGAAGDALLLADTDAIYNVGAYQPGIGQTAGAQVSGTSGSDGMPPAGTAQITGDRELKTGIFALEDASIFNILCLPGTPATGPNTGALAAAMAYAEERRAMMIVDIDPNVDTLDDARSWITDDAGPFSGTNTAAYFPRILLGDPLQQNRLRSFPNSGLIAGLWARTDNQRGIWKAPAGIEAGLRGVRELDYTLSDPENGVLNPLGLNCLRTFPVYGTVAWGGRTLFGADARASEWKYIPVRRTALYIEESLYRGTQFAVFEPNDEPLWSQIRLSVGSFMNNLFRQGAFQGASPQEAYFVRCDSSTTTQADIDLGIVNILVGFAPLKPAEFVIISLQQIAGQGQ
ncbi:phage tail sheath C-terminal domain-containing protein [Algicella marina]|uniref:Phage tail protein n=1 Tax=Algicella marina TaxID=2683284 RepID=A0A6P1T7W9_9RHOB|nr:phage tail sheath C-terminal domain-containing protein [Algicella marina]QHQ36682.1 phage tail protein [Algicella marina]